MLDINKLIHAQDLAACEADEFIQDLAPWSTEDARQMAAEDGLEMTDARYEAICWLREHYAECGPSPNARTLLRAMEDTYASEGGRKYLYRLFPRGPVTQGCRLAGLPVPPGNLDPSFGSVH